MNARQRVTDLLPAHRFALSSQHHAQRMDCLIGQYRYQQMPLNSLAGTVIDRTQPQLRFQTPERRLHFAQGPIQTNDPFIVPLRQ